MRAGVTVAQWPLHMETWVRQSLKIGSFLTYLARDVVRMIATGMKVLRWGQGPPTRVYLPKAVPCWKRFTLRRRLIKTWGEWFYLEACRKG
jgi:hypothetical protein